MDNISQAVKETGANKINPNLPDPHIPSKVTGRVKAEAEKGVVKVGGVKVEPVKEKAKLAPPKPIPLGSIHIDVYANIPYKVMFEEVARGSVGPTQISMAWRHMMKAYRVWKGTEAMGDIDPGIALAECQRCEGPLGPGKHKKFHNKWLCDSCIEKDPRSKTKKR